MTGTSPVASDSGISCLDAAFHVILRQADSFAIVKGEYRRRLIRRFPYQILDESQPAKVIVYGIIRTSRDQKIGLDRLR